MGVLFKASSQSRGKILRDCSHTPIVDAKPLLLQLNP